ncbi:MAG TPA: TonB-dependent receptor, partial [Chitinophagaceae bacterium]
EYQAQLADSSLRWETRIEKNIGLDATLFNNRFTASIDVYNSLSKNVLVLLPVPQYLGSSGSAFVNAGSIRNTGIEFSATYHSPTSGSGSQGLQWSVSGNFTTIKNRVVSVGNQGTNDYLESSNHFIRAQVGHSIGQWYVIRTAGIFQSQQEIDAYVDKNGNMIEPNAHPGDIKFVDANGDGVINNLDRQYAGSPWPTLQAGAQFNATYHQVTINIQLVGLFGNKIYDDVRRVLDSYQLTNFRSDIDPWSPTNPNGKDPRLAVDQPADPQVSQNNIPQSDRWLESGSYVRIRNVEIGYLFQKSVLDRVNFTNARLYISGQNLLTLTKYKGLDPDVQGSGILERGYDVGNWPAARVISIGLQCEF